MLIAFLPKSLYVENTENNNNKISRKISHIFLKLQWHRNVEIDINAMSSQRLLSFLESQDVLDET